MQESVRNVWNGDADLGDNKLPEMWSEYLNRGTDFDDIRNVKAVGLQVVAEKLTSVVNSLKGDETFPNKGLETTVFLYRKRASWSSG